MDGYNVDVCEILGDFLVKFFIEFLGEISWSDFLMKNWKD